MDEDRVDGPAKRSEYPQKSRKNSEAEISIFKLSGGVSGTICDHFTRPGRTGSVATYLAPSWCEVALHSLVSLEVQSMDMLWPRWVARIGLLLRLFVVRRPATAGMG